RGDLTPLSTKVAGIVSAVHISDYQQVHKGDLLVELQDSDFQAQADQAKAAVEVPTPPSKTIFASANFRMLAFRGQWRGSTRPKPRLLQHRQARKLHKPT